MGKEGYSLLGKGNMMDSKKFDFESLDLDKYDLVVENKVRDQSFKILNEYVESIKNHVLDDLHKMHGDNIPQREYENLQKTILSISSKFLEVTMPIYQDLNNFVIKIKRKSIDND